MPRSQRINVSYNFLGVARLLNCIGQVVVASARPPLPIPTGGGGVGTCAVTIFWVHYHNEGT